MHPGAAASDQFRQQTPQTAGTSKKGIDGDREREKRVQQAVSIRKKKQNEVLAKRRREDGGQAPSVPGVDTSTVTVAMLPELNQKLHTEDRQVVHHAATLIRFLLTRKQPFIPEVLAVKGLPERLLSLLREHSLPEIQVEAAWCITNLVMECSDEFSYACINPLVELATRGNKSDCVQQAFWALANIAAEKSTLREAVLRANVMEHLLNGIRSGPSSIHLVQILVWCTQTLCRYREPPHPREEQVSPAVPVLVDVIQRFQDEAVLIDALWGIAHITQLTEKLCRDVINCRAVRRLLQLLPCSPHTLQVPILRVIGNLVAGDDRTTQEVLSEGFLPLLHHVLATRPTVMKEAFWAMSNVAAGTPEQVQQLITNNLIPNVIEAMKSNRSPPIVVREASFVLYNMAAGKGTYEQVDYTVQEGCIPALCEVLRSNDPTLVLRAILTLNVILGKGEVWRQRNGTVNKYAEEVDKCGGLDVLSDLAETDSTEGKNAKRLCEKFFESDEMQMTSIESNMYMQQTQEAAQPAPSLRSQPPQQLQAQQQQQQPVTQQPLPTQDPQQPLFQF
eukprot:TRINITY_DN1513_c0_g1_i2.p1 TRINITY_DN1513_c0_g1~~TRINITY_DN1513_c0_g1_i2.p1  ORF type:complete len:562 (+),score=204.91 TRINITY_DN1513_c0_g1_i2:246-1931(+)